MATTLTKSVRDKILIATATGAYRVQVAQFAGVSYATLMRWLRAGRKAESGEFRELNDAVEAAEGAAAVLMLDAIKKHGKAHWQALAWILERRYPELYGTQARELRQLRGDVTRLSEAVEAIATSEK